MNTYNEKMIKRLSWIKINNENLIQWLYNYITTHSNLFPYFDNNVIHNSPNTPNIKINLINAFLHQAKYWNETAACRETCRNMKSAWLIHERRKKFRISKSHVEVSHTISKKAKNHLDKLSKQNKMSLSQVVETSILNYDELKKIHTEFRNMLYGYGYSDKDLINNFKIARNLDNKPILENRLEVKLEYELGYLRHDVDFTLEQQKNKIKMLEEEIKNLKENNIDNESNKNNQPKKRDTNTQNEVIDTNDHEKEHLDLDLKMSTGELLRALTE
jgi:hypothetical protein